MIPLEVIALSPYARSALVWSQRRADLRHPRRILRLVRSRLAARRPGPPTVARYREARLEQGRHRSSHLEHGLRAAEVDPGLVPGVRVSPAGATPTTVPVGAAADVVG